MAAFLGNLRNVVIASFVLAFLLIGVYCTTQGYDGPAFERYDERFDGRTGLGGLELWIPVRT